MADTDAVTSPKELLWLACREKTCCHNTKVIVSGMDLWRISRGQDLAPEAFAVARVRGAPGPDAFYLAARGPAYGLVLAKQGAIITADPAALSVAPVPACHESKCAPSMTISSALSVPGISAVMLNVFGSSS